MKSLRLIGYAFILVQCACTDTESYTEHKAVTKSKPGARDVSEISGHAFSPNHHEAQFIWKNTFGEAVTVVAIQSSCGCTVVDFPIGTMVEKLEEVELPISINASGRKGKIENSVTLKFLGESGKSYLERCDIDSWFFQDPGVLMPFMAHIKKIADDEGISTELELTFQVMHKTPDLDSLQFKREGAIYNHKIVGKERFVQLDEGFVDEVTIEVKVPLITDPDRPPLNVFLAGKYVGEIALEYKSILDIVCMPQTILLTSGDISGQTYDFEFDILHHTNVVCRLVFGDRAVAEIPLEDKTAKKNGGLFFSRGKVSILSNDIRQVKKTGMLTKLASIEVVSVTNGQVLAQMPVLLMEMSVLQK